MLTHHKSVLLSLISTDLPVSYLVTTTGTLEQKDNERFSLLLTEPLVPEQPTRVTTAKDPCLLWLEISPYRVMMTMQAIAQLNYRHFWEPGVYSNTTYWLNSQGSPNNNQIHLRNFTRRLTLVGRPLPQQLRIEYELWSEKVQMGNYILNLEIQH